jgi:Zn-dependent membrane protease YugP
MFLISANAVTDFFSNLDAYELFFVIVIISYIPILLFGVIMQGLVSSTFRKYQKVYSAAGRSAAETCRSMLNEDGLEYVQITRTGGHLTDHYDPKNQIIALSESVFNSPSVGAIGVACHEAGHAVQHNHRYAFSAIRRVLVPIMNFANNLVFPLLLAGLLLGFLGTSLPYPFGLIFIWAAVGIFGLSMFFSLITLPSEFNASKRALAYLRSSGNFSEEEIKGAKKVLSAAAMTYVAAFLMSTVQFLRFLAFLLLILAKSKRK